MRFARHVFQAVASFALLAAAGCPGPDPPLSSDSASNDRSVKAPVEVDSKQGVSEELGEGPWVTDVASLASSAKCDKYALLVSVNVYRNRVRSLKGPSRDMDELARVLRERFGFAPEAILRLHDSTASRAGILDGLRALKGRAGADKILLFGFSGHGFYAKDTDGEEPDGRDETLCPWDRKTNGAGDIVDDELHDLFTDILANQAHLVTIVDACSSGSVWRAMKARGETKPSPSSSSMVRLAGDGGSVAGVAEEWPDPGSYSGRGQDVEQGEPTLANHPRFVALTACDDRERASESPLGPGGTYRGVFSYVLCGLLNNEEATTLRWEDLRPALSTLVPSLAAKRRRRQHPRMHGNLQLPILRLPTEADRLRSPGVHRVTSPAGVVGPMISIDMGRIHGLAKGAEFRVYGKEDLSESSLAGYYLVRSVRTASCDASWISVRGGDPKRAKDGYAVLFHPGSGPFRVSAELPVDLPSEKTQPLVELLEKDPRYERVKAGMPADVEVTWNSRLGKFEVEGPVPHSPGKPHLKDAKELVTWLRTSFRFQRLLRVQRQFQPRALVAVELLPVDPLDHSLLYPSKEMVVDSGVIHVTPGQSFRLRYANMTKKDRFYTAIVRLSNDGEMSLWNANTYTQRLEPSKQARKPKWKTAGELWKVPGPGRHYLKILVMRNEPYNPIELEGQPTLPADLKRWTRVSGPALTSVTSIARSRRQTRPRRSKPLRGVWAADTVVLEAR